MGQYRYLFTPIQIGPVSIRNRLFTPPYEINLIEDEAKGWWERTAYFEAERAKGGIGLIVMSEIAVHQSGIVYAQTTIDERHVPHLHKLTDMVHENGAKIFQLAHHLGRQAKSIFSYYVNWAPSPIQGPMNPEIPHAMDKDDIKELLDSYRTTAKCLRAANYDGIELQGAHGFLLGSFMSPASNKRSDAYGGSLENRVRLTLQVAEAVREVIGGEMALGITLSVDELNPNGITVEEGCRIAARLEESGLFDYFCARIGDYAAIPIWVGDLTVPPGVATSLAAALKKTVKLPINTVGRIKDPVHAERILAEGQADMVGMARASLADAELANKAREGREDEIRTCISCSQNCLPRVQMGLPVGCVVNPVVGREREMGVGKIPLARTRKRVVVVGGGVAGMKCAETAAQRGHEVILLERAGELGGQVLTAAKIPDHAELAEAATSLMGPLRRFKVDVRLNASGTAESVLALSPDVVVVATGSKPARIPLENPPLQVVNAEQVLNGDVETGSRVVVFDGGESHRKFYGTAEFLARQGKQVTVVTPKMTVGADAFALSYILAYQRFGRLGVKSICNARIAEAVAEGVVIQDIYSQEKTTLLADTLVWVITNVVEDSLYHELREKVPQRFLIGDALAPRKIDRAIWEGFEAALKI